MILAIILAVQVYAAKPIPSEILTITVTEGYKDGPDNTAGKIVRSPPSKAPPDSKIFADKEEILTSISQISYFSHLCELNMISLTPSNIENTYNTNVCVDNLPRYATNQYVNLDSDPPLELRASVMYAVFGFSLKLDSGVVRVWGKYGEISGKVI